MRKSDIKTGYAVRHICLMITAWILAQSCVMGQVNLLTNGDFENGTSPWQLWLNGASASYDVQNGEAVISIISTGGGLGKPQFVHPG